MKNERKKDLLLVGVIAVLIIGILIITNIPWEGNFVKLDYNNYKEKKFNDEDSYVYLGNEETELKRLETLSNDEEYGKKIYYVNLTDKEKEELNIETSIMEIYKNSKLVYTYKDGNYARYDIIRQLMIDGNISKALITVNIDEYEEIVKEKGYNFMFIGQKTCVHCINYKETLKAVIPDYIDKVGFYYIDVSILDESGRTKLYATDTYFSQNTSWGTPLNLLYKDGERISELSGSTTKENTIEFLKTNGVK